MFDIPERTKITLRELANIMQFQSVQIIMKQEGYPNEEERLERYDEFRWMILNLGINLDFLNVQIK
jgi:hypothetical protein